MLQRGGSVSEASSVGQNHAEGELKGEHTGCRCESEEDGEGEDGSTREHGALLLSWWNGRILVKPCNYYSRKLCDM